MVSRTIVPDNVVIKIFDQELSLMATARKRLWIIQIIRHGLTTNG